MLAVRTNMTGFNRKMKALAGPVAFKLSRAIVEDSGKAAVRTLGVISPKDTHRYVSAWQRAGNMAELGPIPVDAIVKSKSYSKNFTKLKRQAEFWTREEKRWKRNLESYERRHRKSGSKSYREARAKYAKIVKLKDRAVQQFQLLDADPGTAIVIRGRNTVKSTSLGQLATVRTRIYGGSGTWSLTSRGWLLTLKNLEPHARIVEYGSSQSKTPAYRPVARVKGLLKIRGAVSVSRAKAKVLKESGLDGK